jgi:hypothetical protein
VRWNNCQPPKSWGASMKKKTFNKNNSRAVFAIFSSKTLFKKSQQKKTVAEITGLDLFA